MIHRVINVDTSALVTEVASDGNNSKNLILPEHILNQASDLLKDVSKPVIIIKVIDTEKSVQVQLPAASIARIANSFPNAIIEVELYNSSFQLQISVLDLKALAKRLGVALKDLKINISMERLSDAVKMDIERIGINRGFKLLGNAVDFKLTAEANGQKVNIRDFGGKYMSRAIVYQGEGIDRNVIAVHYNPVTYEISYIPTQLSNRENGKKEAVMKSPHNSVYAVITTSHRSFTDMNAHWAKKDVELLASKLIVNGASIDHFAPDESITRAEFTSLLVRSLGLSTEHDPAYKGFDDVASDVWYSSEVEAAAKSGLVNGVSANSFAPNEKISRERGHNRQSIRSHLR